MKRTLLLTLLFFVTFTGAIAQNSSELLTNETVISLVEMELDSDIIISKIHSSKVDFKVDVTDLVELKNSNIPTDIIKAMIERQNVMNNSQVAKTGIYYIKDSEEHQIKPTVFASTRTTTLAAELTAGIASAKKISVINNITSENKLSANNLSFIFYFAQFDNNQQYVTDWWFRATTSPAEFVLVVLKTKKNKKTREIETGNNNWFLGSTNDGVNSHKVIKCNITELESGKFSVSPSVQLTPGEYCFFYAGKAPNDGYVNQSVFDFTIE